MPLPRPPIIVILGHVDHGKTTLLDAIRSTDLASREYGGITQKIGAYQIEISDSKFKTTKITFIDTPGHEAFAQMRSRGAKVADIAVLVVAANDSVMPQTVESIEIIKKAEIPFIVAINKIDLPESNFDKVVKDLSKHNVLLENYSGDTPFVKISAKNKEGIENLLDIIRLVADLSEIKADPNGELELAIIESRLDKNRGPVATAIIRNGTLKVGQEINLNGVKSKIRALINYQGKNISEAEPGTPVEILGLNRLPCIGENINTAKEKTVNPNTIKLILKADTNGSLEALLSKLPSEICLLKAETGDITETDIFLAKTANAIVLGFNVKNSAAKLAETERVLVKTYKIIYELLDELNDALSGNLEAEETEEVLGTGKIIAEFPYNKMRVAGVRVIDGRIARGDTVKIDGKTSRVRDLRRGKEEVNKVEKGFECGVLLDPQVDFTIGSDIIAYRSS